MSLFSLFRTSLYSLLDSPISYFFIHRPKSPRNLSLARTDQHVFDWEDFTVRISNFSGKLQSIYFSQHSGGEWIEAQDLEFVEGSNGEVVYSSKHGHTSFARSGMYLQGSALLGIGIRNDTARSDLFVDSSFKYEIVAAEYLGDGREAVVEPPWLGYMREWGPSALVRLDELWNHGSDSLSMILGPEAQTFPIPESAFPSLLLLRRFISSRIFHAGSGIPLRVSVYAGRTGHTCGVASGKLLDRVDVVVDLAVALSRTVAFHSGWKKLGGEGDKPAARLVRAEPDHRFVFQFGCEPECSPVVYQIQGNIK